jgi:protein-S-isoprenylcysteine O-methyltransferase Ste14
MKHQTISRAREEAVNAEQSPLAVFPRSFLRSEKFSLQNRAILLARIGGEEKLLRAHFGDEYNTYCTHTSRLIPGVY